MSNKRFTGISELEPLSLAWYARPVPTMGAALLAALLSVDLKREGLQRPQEVDKLVGQLEPPKENVSREWLHQTHGLPNVVY